MTAEIGRVLGGRYRLVAPIGMGASAQVYLADDVRLRRRVAVKMLHDALADDAEFLRRFRAEARAAAALSHPNIVAVYDWGDEETAFIVTEYLGGGSLRALLDSGAVLSPSQALLVGLETARGLDYAHRRGFVHRDIKPANLLFGEDQRLRVADFGLARALAEAAWTEPQGAMLGTARYASPEQARGETLSGKADVYALALVLVEAVTGEVPFTADTTLGTLMARVDKPLEVPDALGPLQGILARAGHPDAETRIDARTLAAGLLRAAKALPTPAPLPLAGAVAPVGGAEAVVDPTLHAPVTLDDGGAPADGAGTADLTPEDLDLDPPDWVNRAEPAVLVPLAALGADPTVALGEVAADADPEAAATSDTTTDTDTDAAPSGTPDAPAPDEPDAPTRVVPPVVPATEAVIADPARVLAADDEGDGDDVDDVEAVERRRRRWPWVLLVLALIAGAAGAAVAIAGDEGTAAAPRVDLPVPTLTGRTEAEARAIAAAAGWKVRVERVRRDRTTKGDVLASDPAAGERLARGRTLDLTVSAGQTIVPVPTDLAGKSVQDATVELFKTGLRLAEGERRFDEEVAKDVVIGVAAGTPAQLEKGSTVKVVVSDGPKPRVVPSGLVGSTEAEAKAALEAVQLRAAIVRSYSDSVAEGTVISVLPAAGTSVPRGSAVNVEVSRGPKLIAVPDVSGASTISGAISILTGAGLQAGSVSGPATGSPVGTSPAAGTMVRPGSTVNIVLG